MNTRHKAFLNIAMLSVILGFSGYGTYSTDSVGSVRREVDAQAAGNRRSLV
jgi:hypothetical protein